MSDPITLREASRLTNLSPSTFRKWIRNGTLRSLKKQGNKHLVDRNEVLAVAGTASQTEHALEQSQNVTELLSVSQIEMYQTQIRYLERSLEREQNAKDTLQRTVDNLHRELFALTHEIRELLQSQDGKTWKLPFRWMKG